MLLVCILKVKLQLQSKKKAVGFAAGCMWGAYLSPTLSATVNSDEQPFLEVIGVVRGEERARHVF